METMSDILDNNDDIIFNEETGLPVKAEHSRHLRDIEVCCMILEYVVQDCRISSREIERQTGLNARTINKYRNSEMFAKMLVEYTNKKMVNVRCKAVEELEKLLNDKSLNSNTKIKAIQTALQHSEVMADLALKAEKKEKVSVDDILKELEGLD